MTNLIAGAVGMLAGASGLLLMLGIWTRIASDRPIPNTLKPLPLPPQSVVAVHQLNSPGDPWNLPFMPLVEPSVLSRLIETHGPRHSLSGGGHPAWSTTEELALANQHYPRPGLTRTERKGHVLL